MTQPIQGGSPEKRGFRILNHEIRGQDVAKGLLFLTLVLSACAPAAAPAKTELVPGATAAPRPATALVIAEPTETARQTITIDRISLDWGGPLASRNPVERAGGIGTKPVVATATPDTDEIKTNIATGARQIGDKLTQAVEQGQFTDQLKPKERVLVFETSYSVDPVSKAPTGSMAILFKEDGTILRFGLANSDEQQATFITKDNQPDAFIDKANGWIVIGRPLGEVDYRRPTNTQGITFVYNKNTMNSETGKNGLWEAKLTTIEVAGSFDPMTKQWK